MMTIACALALYLAGIASAAQEPAAQKWNLQIDAVAVDGDGKPVTDLRPDEFEIWISGFRVPIAEVLAVTYSTHPRTVVLLLDNAAIGPTLAPRVKESARHLANAMQPGDRVGFLTLQGGKLEMPVDRDRLLRAIDAFYVQGFPFRPEDGGEHVLQTLAALSRQLGEMSDVRKVVVAIGAGWIFDTPLPPPGVRDLQREWIAAMRAMAAAHASLYVIDPVGVGMTRGAAGYGGDSGFARETGGHAFVYTNDTRSAAERIWAEAGTYYMLRIPDPPVQRAAELREVEVKVLRKGVTVRARRGIRGKP